MDFQVLILLLASLACPIGMGAMMWWMRRGMGNQSAVETTPPLRRPRVPPVPRTGGVSGVSEIVDDLAKRNQALETRLAELEQRLAVQRQTEP